MGLFRSRGTVGGEANWAWFETREKNEDCEWSLGEELGPHRHIWTDINRVWSLQSLEEEGLMEDERTKKQQGR